MNNVVHIQLTPQIMQRMTGLGFRPPAAHVLRLHPNCRFEAPTNLSGIFHARTPISIGAFTLINNSSIGLCSLGRYCSLAPNVVIGMAEHPADFLTTSTAGWQRNFMNWRDQTGTGKLIPVPFEDRPHTSIGNDVWIGNNAFIKAGVTIADGAIVAAGAVVVKDVGPYEIIGGVPGRVLRHRFSPDIIERLLKLKWWDYRLFDFEIQVDNVEASLDWMEEHLPQMPRFEPSTYSSLDLKMALEAPAGCARV